MAINVLIPTPLRKLTQNAENVSAEGKTVGDLIDNLETSYPGIKERLITPDGGVHRFINVYLGEEDIRFLDNLNTPVKDGDTVSIVPAIAGG